MFTRLLLALTITLSTVGLASGSDYQVIEVGGCNYPAPALYKWSPDGTKLAFFRGKILCISDTLGQVSEISELQYLPRKFEWIDDEALAVCQAEQVSRKEHQEGKPRHYLISEVNIDGTATVVRQETVHHLNQTSLKKLEKGHNGTVYVYERKRKGIVNHAVLPVYNTPLRKTKSEDDFVLGINKEGIYKINLFTGDSIMIFKNERGYTSHKSYQRPLMNHRQDLMLVGRGALILLNLVDSSEVILDKYIEKGSKDVPYCGFGSLSFCPISNLLIFEKTCDDGITRVVGNICSFDYDTHTFTSYPSFTGSDEEYDPVMSSDGRHVAFLSMTKGICIVKLEGGDNVKE